MGLLSSRHLIKVRHLANMQHPPAHRPVDGDPHQVPDLGVHHVHEHHRGPPDKEDEDLIPVGGSSGGNQGVIGW